MKNFKNRKLFFNRQTLRTLSAEIIGTKSRIILLWLAVLVAMASASARADTLPSGAQPVAGSVDLLLVPTPLPITIPEGWVFVLTDFEGAADLRIFSADDRVNPKYRASFAGRSLQTGLVFSEPPLVAAAHCGGGCAGIWFSFSGYLKPMDVGGAT